MRLEMKWNFPFTKTRYHYQLEKASKKSRFGQNILRIKINTNYAGLYFEKKPF